MLVAPDWKGIPAVLVAGGASFSAADARLIGMARAKDLIRVIAINDAVYPCWFADILYACDRQWWEYHRGVPGFGGRRIRLANINDRGVDTNDPMIPGIEAIARKSTEGVSTDPSFITTGGNSGHQALNLALHLSPSAVVLVAYDVGGPHWFGEHPKEIRRRPADVMRRVKGYMALADEFEARGIPLLNASRSSPIRRFPIIDLETYFSGLEARHA